MLKMTVKAKGRTQNDLELALEQVLEKVRESYISGSDSNETGGYTFTQTGEEDENVSAD